MESIMFDFISKIRCGEIKEFKNLTIIPLFVENGPKSPDYLIMEDAINSRLLIIGEKVIHTAFFKIEKEDITGNMSSYKDRIRSRYAR